MYNDQWGFQYFYCNIHFCLNGTNNEQYDPIHIRFNFCYYWQYFKCSDYRPDNKRPDGRSPLSKQTGTKQIREIRSINPNPVNKADKINPITGTIMVSLKALTNTSPIGTDLRVGMAKTTIAVLKIQAPDPREDHLEVAEEDNFPLNLNTQTSTL